MTNTINIYNVKEELTVFLRNSDILTTTQRGVTTTTEEFNGDNSEVDFVASNTPLRNVRSVTVGGVSQSYGSDYTVDYVNATITFTSAPATGVNNVDIEYDYGSSDKIFPDLPRDDIKISSVPRIGIDMIGMDTSELGIGGTSNISNLSFSIVVYDTQGYQIEGYLDSIRTAIQAAKKSFYYIDFLTFATIGPLLVFVNGKDKIYQRNIDVFAPYNIEEV